MSQLIINPNERAVSADINRLQTMLRTLIEEPWRWMLNAHGYESQAGNANSVDSTVTTPLSGVVLNGLMGLPGIATNTVTVTPGVGFVVDVDVPPDADASPFKLIVDPGTLTALTIPSNTSGLTRIDVLECQRNPGVVIEQATRDTFDGAVGVFNAVTVDKVSADRLTYRLRSGTPGAGYAGNVNGWLPLMICVVPNGFTSCDDCTFYDVRPLASDNIKRPFSIVDSWPGMRRLNAQALPNVYVNAGLQPTKLTLLGMLETWMGSRVLGGDLAPLDPLVPAYDLLDAANQEQGFAWPANSQGLWFLYLATFYGLPRWVRYTPASVGSRSPYGPRGIPILSLTPPSPLGVPSVALHAPLASGLAATTFAAMVALCAPYQTLGHAFPMVAGCRASRGRVEVPEQVNSTVANTAGFFWLYPAVAGYPTATIVNPVVGTIAEFTITDNVSHPMGATAVKLRCNIRLDYGPPPVVLNNFVRVSTRDQSDGSAADQPKWTHTLMTDHNVSGVTTSGQADYYFEATIPLYASRATPVSRTVRVEVAAQGSAPSPIVLLQVQVLGWELPE